jgi:hypothetical protein
MTQRVESNKYKQVVQQDVPDATSKGVRGTPAFVIGKSIPAGVEIELMNEPQLYTALNKKVKSMMNSQGVTSSSERKRGPADDAGRSSVMA